MSLQKQQREELLDRFRRAQQRLLKIVTETNPEHVLKGELSDSHPDVAFLIHALELLFTHGLVQPFLLTNYIWDVVQHLVKNLLFFLLFVGCD